jgi:hypothetical protein
MTTAIAPQKKITFTIKHAPHREADTKTILRLMRMQRSVQNGLRVLSRRRRRENVTSPRAGRFWTSRIPASKIVHVLPGETFTLTVTPQIMPDIKAVEKYLEAKAAK